MKKFFPYVSLPVLLITILSSLLLFETYHDTPTYDEPANIAASYAYVYKNDFRIYPDNPPLIKILAGLFLYPIHRQINFPENLETYRDPEKFDLYSFGRSFLYQSGNDTRKIIFLTRLPNVLITIALGILLYFFARKIYSENAGLLALTLYSLDPNIRGHGHILAFDIPLAFIVILIIYITFKGKTFKGIIPFLFAIGFLTKFSFIFFALIYFFVSRKTFITSLIFSFLIIWLFGLTTNYNTKTFDYDQVPIIASANQTLKSDFKWNLFKVLPLPYFYKTGMQIMYTHNVVSQPAFLFGQVRVKNDWFLYFPISFVIKSTIPLLVFSGWTIFFLFKKTDLSLKKIFPFTIGLLFMLFMMFSSHINNVFRYLLPTYILFMLGASRVIDMNKLLSFALVGYLLLTSVFSFPYDLSYTNEFTGIPPQGHKFLSDSEVDWGQDLERLALWLKKNNLQNQTITLSYLGTADPSYYGIKYKTLKFNDLKNLSGIVAISVGNLTLGDWQTTSTFEYKIKSTSAPLDFLRAKNPDAIIGKSIFVYHL